MTWSSVKAEGQLSLLLWIIYSAETSSSSSVMMPLFTSQLFWPFPFCTNHKGYDQDFCTFDWALHH